MESDHPSRGPNKLRKNIISRVRVDASKFLNSSAHESEELTDDDSESIFHEHKKVNPKSFIFSLSVISEGGVTVPTKFP